MGRSWAKKSEKGFKFLEKHVKKKSVKKVILGGVCAVRPTSRAATRRERRGLGGNLCT